MCVRVCVYIYTAHHDLLVKGLRRMNFKASMAVVFLQAFSAEQLLQVKETYYKGKSDLL